jgi:cell division protein FtsZ
MGKAMMGTGEAEGEDRAARAADMAISNPLLDDVTMKGAKGVLINITGGPDLMLFEVEQAANRIRAEVDPDANIIFGNTILDEMEGRIRVSVVATGIDADQLALPEKVVTHNRFKAAAVKTEKPAFQIRPELPAANPVHATVNALADSLNASPNDDYILGGADAPAMEEPAPSLAEKYPAVESYRPLEQQPLAAQPAPEKKRGWGFLGRAKPKASDLRAEPAPRAPEPRATEPRAVAQPMTRPAASLDAPPPPAPSDDLFPEQNRDDQFEIPAFLRRQSN